MTSISLRRAALFAALFLAWPATAAEPKPFDQASFAAAQSAGSPIVVEISAIWCPTCWAQKPIIEKLSQSPEYKDMVILTVNYDSQKDVVRALGARSQSTLIAFRGAAETARSVGDTDPGSVEALFKSTLAR
ncbi:MAG: thioredoxin family protein [Rhizobium sp.]|nr:thioredoxin family protein [Rhizobium sp.]